MKFTSSTYKRIAEDEDYSNKAIDSLLRAEHGQNVQYEVVGNKVVINGTKIVDKSALMTQSVDFQSSLKERPELEQYYKDRQNRVERAEKHFNPNLQEKSKNEIMADGAMKAMLSNAGRRGIASQKQQSSKTNLPSERD